MPHENRLIHATSPYLLQHAHNPVDWFEWGEEALKRARNEDKPILISIGYSSCHWCHVMERESFENDAIAKVMNDYFVCIKVDREERPDIDQIYMEAVQALGVNGGWPLNIFLTPEQKPFFGGTYFSPQGWVQILQNIHNAYLGNRQQLEDTAEELRLHLLRSDVARFRQESNNTAWASDLKSIYSKLKAGFDTEWGGLDKAPKFVMPSVWQLLLRYYHLTSDRSALDHVLFTLDKIAQGGIYDQVGGGFARYSVDAQWFAPHFEKMLYDNAQLMSLYSDAYKLSGNETYKTIVYETFEWLEREMTHADGGFYSALDADSEGIEGKYYVWTKKELEHVLGADEKLISDYYSVVPSGNWEHGSNIMTRAYTDTAFQKKHQLQTDHWNILLKNVKDTLLRRREERIRPGLDDKIITSWNAMMICGLTDAYAAFDDSRFLSAALKGMSFIEERLADADQLYRSFKGRRSTTKAFLDDYAYVIQAQLKLYQATFDDNWIHKAASLISFTLEHFFDPSEGFFFYTSSTSEKLISRKKEIFDNVIPSSNAIMAQNLFQAGTILEREAWVQHALTMTGSLTNLTTSEPNYMSQWAIAALEMRKGMKEVLITGSGVHTLRTALQKEFFPFILMQGAIGQGKLPLFEGKVPLDGKDTIYVCYQKTCALPVHTLTEAKEQISQA